MEQMNAAPPLRSGEKTILLIAVFLLAAVTAAIVVAQQHIAHFFALRYPIQGIDASHYQGAIDWPQMEQQGIRFAYLKATEGSGHVDECFALNREGARKSRIVTGAYHFFSFESPAETQAALYIDTVGPLRGELVPVIDVEYYGTRNRPEKHELLRHLRTMLELLEAQYDVKPIIYSTASFYKTYLKGELTEYPLWIRNVYLPPYLVRKNTWVLWQYTDRAELNGYDGDERFIDRDAFRGNEEAFAKFIVGN